MWIEIFRSGEQTDSNGSKASFTDMDIQEMADNYNQKLLEEDGFSAPLVKGHPKNDSPAHGWIEKLARRKNMLYAKLGNLSDTMISNIENGAFKKVSVALYPDNLLKHVGLLGGAQPAVKGLRNVEFAEHIPTVFENEIEKLKKENDELKQKLFQDNVKSIQSKHKEFAESMIKEKKIFMPAQKDNLLKILKLSSNFSEPFDDNIIDLFDNINSSDIHEILPQKEVEEHKISFTENVNEDRLRIHTNALKIMKNTPELNYEEAAIKAVSEFTNEI